MSHDDNDIEKIDEAQDAAQQFLIGELMTAARARFVTLAEPYTKMREHEQAALLRGLADDVRAAVAKAIEIIASNARVAFRAEVEGVTFKGASDVKATLKLSAHNVESHLLADAAGKFVTVVIEDTTTLLDVPAEAVKGTPDNGVLPLEPIDALAVAAKVDAAVVAVASAGGDAPLTGKGIDAAAPPAPAKPKRRPLAAKIAKATAPKPPAKGNATKAPTRSL